MGWTYNLSDITMHYTWKQRCGLGTGLVPLGPGFRAGSKNIYDAQTPQSIVAVFSNMVDRHHSP